MAFRIPALLLLLAALGVIRVQPVLAGASFTPHRAVYALSLGEHYSGKETTITDASGQLEFEWADVCDGWAVRQRTGVVMTQSDGSEIDFGWTLNSWEAKDGLSYRFFIRRLTADHGTEEVRGRASLDGPGLGGAAHYSVPDGRSVDLPQGTIFPTQHSLEMIAAATKDELPFWRIVFDGSGDEGMAGISATLVSALPPEADQTPASPLLAGQRSWRVLLAYFSPDPRMSEPEHEQALRLYANGVIDSLTLDYGDFALSARLEKLEPLPPPDC